MELGSEPAFELLCRKLASDFRIYPEERFLPHRMPYDRRWPVILSNFEGQPIEISRGSMDNLWAEEVYTSAVWQAVAGHVLPVRRAQSLRLVKSAYVIGNGLAFDDGEMESLGEPIPLLEFEGPDGVTYEADTFHCSRTELAHSLKEVSSVTVSRHGPEEEFERFLQQCTQLSRVVPSPHLVAFYNPDGVDPSTRCLQAVRIALGDNRIFGETDVTLGWINHHRAAPILSLRHISSSTWRPGCSEKANRLVLCWMELGMMADTLRWLDDLSEGPQGSTKGLTGCASAPPRHPGVAKPITESTETALRGTTSTAASDAAVRVGTPPPRVALATAAPQRSPHLGGNSSPRPASALH